MNLQIFAILNKSANFTDRKTKDEDYDNKTLPHRHTDF